MGELMTLELIKLQRCRTLIKGGELTLVLGF